MSTQIGTLQPKARTAQPMWPVAILALLVVAIVVAIVTAPEGSRPRDETTSFVDTPVSSGVPATHGKHLGAGIALPQPVAGTVANTPTELTGGIAFSTAGAVTSAPTDLSGRFLAERAKQLGTEIGGAAPSTTGGDELCEICWKYR